VSAAEDSLFCATEIIIIIIIIITVIFSIRG